jgi:hypothetical protein
MRLRRIMEPERFGAGIPHTALNEEFEMRAQAKAVPMGAAVAASIALLAGGAAAQQQASTTDPRVGLRAGWHDAGSAISNMQLLSAQPRPVGFFDAANPGDGAFSNTDLAFRGNYAYVGNYHGIQIYDISDPTAPRLRATLVCPGGQGDVSIHGNLLFMSAQEPRGRTDCGVQGVEPAVSRERFRGVRIFDISELSSIRQVAAVQTCRGSHTHTILAHPGDRDNVYVYNSGTSPVRPGEEMPGCSALAPDEDPNTALFRIEVIQVPLARPQDARIVNAPRIFADATGNIAGLWAGGDHGPGTQSSRITAQCHDITTYPEIGLAGGACSGNGILLDIRDPANPRRVAEVVDEDFAFWHSATFNNDGSKVIFTDEWGGGTQPRCRVTDRMEWGANAIFDIVDGALQFRSYYKLPAAQTEMENCVAHNGSLVPVPGRDIKVQSWYQGGISVFDFTDSANPMEIAYFDRGPISSTELISGGYWSAYWYNGHIYGSEIYRGFDVFRLTPSEHLTQNEIEAANLVRYDEFNPQHQPKVSWPAHPAVARAYIDQLVRSSALAERRAAELRDLLSRHASGQGAARTGAASALTSVVPGLQGEASSARAANRAADARRFELLAEVLRELGRSPTR